MWALSWGATGRAAEQSMGPTKITTRPVCPAARRSAPEGQLSASRGRFATTARPAYPPRSPTSAGHRPPWGTAAGPADRRLRPRSQPRGGCHPASRWPSSKVCGPAGGHLGGWELAGAAGAVGRRACAPQRLALVLGVLAKLARHAAAQWLCCSASGAVWQACQAPVGEAAGKQWGKVVGSWWAHAACAAAAGAARRAGQSRAPPWPVPHSAHADGTIQHGNGHGCRLRILRRTRRRLLTHLHRWRRRPRPLHLHGRGRGRALLLPLPSSCSGATELTSKALHACHLRPNAPSPLPAFTLHSTSHVHRLLPPLPPPA